MKLLTPQTNTRQILTLSFFVLFLFCVQAIVPLAPAQNLGSQPAVNKAVQGQTASQPEGAFLNLVNWVGNVICPVGAALVRGDGGCQLHARARAWRDGRSPRQVC